MDGTKHVSLSLHNKHSGGDKIMAVQMKCQFGLYRKCIWELYSQRDLGGMKLRRAALAISRQRDFWGSLESLLGISTSACNKCYNN